MVLSREQNNFLSSDGFNSKVWGPPLWFIIHILAANFPLRPRPAQSRAYFFFFRSLCELLPCKNCRQEFCTLVNDKHSKFYLTPSIFTQGEHEKLGAARTRVFRWTVQLHASVNKRLNHQYTRDVALWKEFYASMRRAR